MKRYEGLHLQVTSLSSDYLNLITMDPLFSKLLVNISIQLRTEILVETTRSVIPNQQRDEYLKNMWFWNFATCKWKGHNGKIKIISLVIKFSSSLSIYMCMSSHQVLAELRVSFISSAMGQERSTQSPRLELLCERTQPIQRQVKFKNRVSLYWVFFEEKYTIKQNGNIS